MTRKLNGFEGAGPRARPLHYVTSPISLRGAVEITTSSTVSRQRSCGSYKVTTVWINLLGTSEETDTCLGYGGKSDKKQPARQGILVGYNDQIGSLRAKVCFKDTAKTD